MEYTKNIEAYQYIERLLLGNGGHFNSLPISSTNAQGIISGTIAASKDDIAKLEQACSALEEGSKPKQ